jgi:antitoxin HicB
MSATYEDKIDLDAVPEIVLDPEQEKRLAEVLTRAYHREVVREEDGWVARLVEWSGCIGSGETAAEALADLEDAMKVWAGSCLADGVSIPEPIREDAFSGKLVLRIPRSLHRDAARLAAHEHVSLNQYISNALARMVGNTGSGVA